MNRTFIPVMAAVLIAATLFTSCQPSRVWTTRKKDKEEKQYREREVYNDPAPPASRSFYNRVALVVRPYPGFVMKQTSDGRFYHRSQQGLLYWKGYDNRFYLDKRDMRNVSYTRADYEEWRRGARG